MTVILADFICHFLIWSWQFHWHDHGLLCEMVPTFLDENWDIYGRSVKCFKNFREDSDAEMDETYFCYHENTDANVRKVRLGRDEREQRYGKRDSWLDQVGELTRVWRPARNNGGQATYIEI